MMTRTTTAVGRGSGLQEPGKRATLLAVCALPLFLWGVEAQGQAGTISDTDESGQSVAELRRAAERGDAASQFELARKLKDGYFVLEGKEGLNTFYRKVPADKAGAIRWYRKSAEQGYRDAYRNLALMVSFHPGTARDQAEAVRWFRKQAERGQASAQYWLGDFYRWGNGGLAVDDTAAARWYRRAAEQGEAAAQVGLGDMYAAGNGVAHDDVEAVRWYRKAAEQREPFGQYQLGLMNEQGRGVAKNEAEAAKWYRLAADQHVSSGAYALGQLYENGRGVAKNEAEAAKLYRLAAADHFDLARIALADLYAQGRGVRRNLVCAYFWYGFAAKEWSGNILADLAPRKRDALTPELTPAELAEGKRLVAAAVTSFRGIHGGSPLCNP